MRFHTPSPSPTACQYSPPRVGMLSAQPVSSTSLRLQGGRVGSEASMVGVLCTSSSSRQKGVTEREGGS